MRQATSQEFHSEDLRGRWQGASGKTLVQAPGQRLAVLCLGAHSDDIEIGAGGAVLHWARDGIDLDITWCVLSAAGPRKVEAVASANDFLAGIGRSRIETQEFRDGFFPAESAELKGY